MSEKPQSERYCKTCGDRHLPPTGSKCPRVSSISPTKLAARFMNLDVDRGAGFTDHEGAVGNDSAEQWDTAFSAVFKQIPVFIYLSFSIKPTIHL